jgi:hypothetical protein
MAARLFRSIDLNGSRAKRYQLQAQCKKLYEDIVAGYVDEAVMEDFCSCLKNEDFFDAASLYFPVLQQARDEFAMDASDYYLDRIRRAARQYAPENLLGPAAHNEAILSVRRCLSTLAHFVRIEDLSVRGKAEIFRVFEGLFDIAGK